MAAMAAFLPLTMAADAEIMECTLGIGFLFSLSSCVDLDSGAAQAMAATKLSLHAQCT